MRRGHRAEREPAIAHQWKAEDLLMIERRFAEADSAIAESLDPGPQGADRAAHRGEHRDGGRRSRGGGAPVARAPAGGPFPTSAMLLKGVLVIRADTAALRTHLERFEPGLAAMAAHWSRRETTRLPATPCSPWGTTGPLLAEARLRMGALREGTVWRLRRRPSPAGGVVGAEGIRSAAGHRDAGLRAARNEPRFRRILDGLRLTKLWAANPP